MWGENQQLGATDLGVLPGAQRLEKGWGGPGAEETRP